MIVEPLVQCAGSMRMYDPVYLELLRDACDRYEVHLIADEIAVGFGRTGTMFACEQAGIRPDFMCLSKGLTAGYLPLSAVLTTETGVCGVLRRIHEAECVPAFTQLHGQSAGLRRGAGEPARSSGGQRARAQPDTRRRTWAHGQRDLESHPHVAEVRQRGMIVAIELVRDKARRERRIPGRNGVGSESTGTRLERGVLLRPVGNVVYFMPPYVITPEEIDLMVDVAREGIERATCD